MNENEWDFLIHSHSFFWCFFLTLERLFSPQKKGWNAYFLHKKRAGTLVEISKVRMNENEWENLIHSHSFSLFQFFSKKVEKRENEWEWMRFSHSFSLFQFFSQKVEKRENESHSFSFIPPFSLFFSPFLLQFAPPKKERENEWENLIQEKGRMNENEWDFLIHSPFWVFWLYAPGFEGGLTLWGIFFSDALRRILFLLLML